MYLVVTLSSPTMTLMLSRLHLTVSVTFLCPSHTSDALSRSHHLTLLTPYCCLSKASNYLNV